MARIRRGPKPEAEAAPPPEGSDGGGSSSSTARPHAGDVDRRPDEDRGGGAASRAGGSGGEVAAPNSGADPAPAAAAGAAEDEEELALDAPGPREPPAAPRSGGYTSQHFAPAAEVAAAVDRGAVAQLREAQEVREEQQRRSSPRGVPSPSQSPTQLQEESSSGGEEVRLDVEAEGEPASGPAGRGGAAAAGAAFGAGGVSLDEEDADFFAGISPPPAPPPGGASEDVGPRPPSEQVEQLQVGVEDDLLAQTKGSSIVALDEKPLRADQKDQGGNDDGDDRVPAAQKNWNMTARNSFQELTESRFFMPFLGYSRLVVQCPWCCVIMYLILICVVTAALWRPVQLDNDLSSFVRADGQALRYYDAYSHARKEQQDLNNKFLAGGRRLQDAGYEEWILKGFQIVYATRDGSSVVDSRALLEARDLENQLRSLPGWTEFCITRSSPTFPRWLCDPGESLVAYSWPTEKKPLAEHEAYRLLFDRKGSEYMSIQEVMAYFDQIKNTTADLRGDPLQYLPKNFTRWTLDTAPPTILRSRFNFPIIYGDMRQTPSELTKALRKTEKEYEAFILGEVYPILSTASEKTKYIEVFYSSGEMNKHEVLSAMETDILWALGSIGFVTAYMGVHVRSVPFTAGAFFSIFASVPVAYVLVPTGKTTFASLMSLFLITVIDIDIIFMFNDMWKQSARWGEVDVRLAWTIIRAGRSCMATSVTTSVSFFANLLSALPPLREFGLFMGLCVTNVFVLALMLLPPLIVVRERNESKRRHVAEQVASPKAMQQGSGNHALPSAPSAAKGRADEERGPDALEPLKLAVDGVGDDGAPEPAPSNMERERSLRADKTSSTCMNIFLYRLVDCISTCPCLITLAALGTMALLFYSTATGISLEEGTPNIFQPDHNQIRGKALMGQFRAFIDSSMGPLPRFNVTVCDAPNSTAEPPTTCDLSWCSMVPQEASSNLEGSCWRGPTTLSSIDGNVDNGFSVDGCESVLIQTQLQSNDTSFVDDWAEAWKAIIANFTAPVNSLALTPTLKPMLPVLMEDWESGSVVAVNSYEVAVAVAEKPRIPDKNTWCTIHAICAFGPQRCPMPGFVEAGRINLTGRTNTSARRLQDTAAVARWQPEASRHLDDSAVPPSRRLIMWAATLPENKQINTAVVYGIWAPHSSPLVGVIDDIWKWDSKFEPDNPWSQRAMAAMCDPQLFHDELLVVRKQCWIDDFKLFLVRKNGRFPSRNFDEDAAAWFRADYTDTAKKDLWMVDGKVRAARLNFWADFNRQSSPAKALEYMVHWDKYVAERNKEATMSGNNAWHTSEVWVRSEAQVAIVSSTIATILTELILGTLGILCFTGDPVLALIVLCLIIGNVGGLACFMVSVMKWAIGPIEIIFLVVFLGYSVTFGLHMALNYSQVRMDDPTLSDVERWIKGRKDNLAQRRAGKRKAVDPGLSMDGGELVDSPSPLEPKRQTAREIRKVRTRMAVLRVGGAIFSSTLSTIGSSIFLLFCTLNIFIRLGWVIIAVVTMSLVSTLIVLPAVLLLIGPGPNPVYKRVPAQCFERLLRRLRKRRAAKASTKTPLLM